MRMKAGKAGGDFNDASGRRRSPRLYSLQRPGRGGGGSDAVMCCGVMMCCVVWVCRFRIVWLAYCNSFLSLSWGVLCCVWVVQGCDDQFSRVSIYCNALCCVVCCVLCFVVFGLCFDDVGLCVAHPFICVLCCIASAVCLRCLAVSYCNMMCYFKNLFFKILYCVYCVL